MSRNFATALTAGKACDWHAKGEGNANLVYDYVGTSSVLAGSVLRVRKPAAAGGAIGSPETKAKGMRHLTALELELWEPLLQLLPEDACKDEQAASRAYMLEWLIPLLGPQHVFPGVPCRVPPGLLIPSSSVHSGDVHAPDMRPNHQATGLLLPDHSVFAAVPPGYMAAGPALCIEVKTKSGAPLIAAQAAGCGAAADQGLQQAAADTLAAQYRYPRYVLHALLKHVQSGQALGSYNPLDLFSCEPPRMHAALMALLRQPSNNLRVFRDGQLVYGGRPAHSHAAAEHSDAYSSAEHMHMDLPGLMACLEGDLALPPMQWQAQHITPQHAAHSTQTQMRQQQPAAGRCLQQPEVCVPAAGAGPGPEAAAASAADGMAAERSLRSERGGHALMRLVASVLQASGVLPSLRAVQSMSTLSIAAAAKLYTHLLWQGSGSVGGDGSGLGLNTSGGDTDSNNDDDACMDAYDAADVARVLALPRAEAMAALRTYLTAATAKDCGIMLTLQRIERCADLEQQQQGSGAGDAVGGMGSMDSGGVCAREPSMLLRLQPPALYLMQAEQVLHAPPPARPAASGSMSAAAGVSLPAAGLGQLLVAAGSNDVMHVGSACDDSVDAAPFLVGSPAAGSKSDEAGGAADSFSLPLLTRVTSVLGMGVVECAPGSSSSGSAVRSSSLPPAPPLFMAKVALVDLDLKPLAKLPAHWALEREVRACAAAHMELLQAWQAGAAEDRSVEELTAMMGSSLWL